jgi:hypothetical protein
MMKTPREIVKACLKFEYPERIPRDPCIASYVAARFPEAVREINRRFPSDICWAKVENVYRPSPRVKGDKFGVGIYVDEWGCVFNTLQEGMGGSPVIQNIDNFQAVVPPYEILPEDVKSARDAVNLFCKNTSRFVLANCSPDPWERYKLLRGTENALVDVIASEKECKALLKIIHEFNLKVLEFWITTNVDAIRFSDDWGSQQSLLVAPEIWRSIFKPLYADYCNLIHSKGKFVFMHCCGQILEIYEDLIEIGVDAINSQLFVMDMAELSKRAKGKITFWGDIDRQHVLPSSDPLVGRNAVKKVVENFYDPAGGIIAQLWIDPGANLDTAIAILEEWDKHKSGVT